MNNERILISDSFSYTIRQGLSTPQAQEMETLYGKNCLTPPPKTPWWVELFSKFKDPTIQILLAAALISLVITAVERYLLGNGEVNFVDSIGIFLAVSLAILVGFFSERKSAREFELLNRVKEDILVKTIRNGSLHELSIEALVVGDLVRLDPGDKVPADGLLLDVSGLFMDQSMMTGESHPVRKSAIDLPESSLSDLIAQSKPNHDAFVARGTMVADGHGLFVVTAVGDQTEMGKIARALSVNDESKQETPLVAKLGLLARQISILGVVGASSIFSVMIFLSLCNSPLKHTLTEQTSHFLILSATSLLLGFLLMYFGAKPFFKQMAMPLRSKRFHLLAMLPLVLAALTILLGLHELVINGNEEVGINLLKETLLAFVVAVTIVVVAVPEGLPMMVTVSLALNMMKMARENCLVRKLVASETIGSATVICTDKTGTLTQNKMRPVWVFCRQKEYDSTRFSELFQTSEWTSLVRGIAINSSAILQTEPDSETAEKKIVGIGNPTECALLKYIHSEGTDPEEERASVKKIFELGHNSDRKLSVVVAQSENEERCYIKGAPERILAGCTTVLVDGESQPIESCREEIEQALQRASRQAYRVIAFSEKILEKGGCANCATQTGGSCLQCQQRQFIGLVGLADPVREEVSAAVETCLQAGVQVKMITGDALPTAIAIARHTHIYQEQPEELVLTSEEFNAIPDEELPEKARRLKVLARSTPMDKLRLVKALHRQNEVVAMTGDGTNDAPALKYADVGLAMGITGTEVAKEASDIVLVDDNFTSIVTGIWWGRTLFQNIQRFLQFQLSVNIVALLCALIGPLVGIPLPLTVTQLLWINIIMDTFAAIALSTDPPRPHTMKEKPIDRNAHIITGTMGITMIFVSLYQVAILFTVLFRGWFVDAAHQYDASISITDPAHREHNLQALTIFFTVLVMFQFWHKINCRALRSDESPFELLHKNRLFIVIVSLITIVQIVMVQSEWVGQFFRTEPLSLYQWLCITGLTFSVIPVAWVGRQLSKILTRQNTTDHA